MEQYLHIYSCLLFRAALLKSNALVRYSTCIKVRTYGILMILDHSLGHRLSLDQEQEILQVLIRLKALVYIL